MIMAPDYAHTATVGSHVGVRGEPWAGRSAVGGAGLLRGREAGCAYGAPAGRVDQVIRDLVTGREMFVVELDQGFWATMRPEVTELRPRC